MNGIKEDGWILIDQATGWPVQLGDTRRTSRNEQHQVTGGRPPHKPSSTGRIYVQGSEYFPSVLDAAWVREDALASSGIINSSYTMQGVHLMNQIGGGFASALARAFFAADAGNRMKLLRAFEGLFRGYVEEAAQQVPAAEPVAIPK